MKTFEMVLDDIYARANKVQITEKRRNRRIAKIATACASICIIFVVALAVIRPFDDKTTEDERIVLEGTNGDKKWISDIPGAVYIENPEYFVAENKNPAPPPLRDVTVKFLQNSLVVIGDVENIKSFYIKEGDYYIWYITTFDIKISMDVHGAFETDTLKCVTSFKYLYDGTSAIKCGLPNVAKEIIDNPSGAFVVKKASQNNGWSLGGVFHSACDYADYYVTYRYDYSSKGIFDSYGELMTFDEINCA